MRDPVLTEWDGSIVTVVLNHPERMNALDLTAWKALARTFATLDAEDRVRCIVVRGAGDRAFAAGADIAAFETERTATNARAYGEAEMGGILGVARSRHPTVALIQGACVGGGLEIACACDIRICGTSSRFGAPINRLGLTMAYDELQFFIGAVGRKAALEILLEGSVFGAERALALGLVSRVVGDADVADEAYATAHRIAEGAPLVNRWHKQFARRLMDPAPLSDDEVAEGYAAFRTADYRTGYRAFLEKRKPEFEGR